MEIVVIRPENFGLSNPQFTCVFAPSTTAASFSCSVSILWRSRVLHVSHTLGYMCLLLIDKARVKDKTCIWLLFIINRESERWSQNLWMSRWDERLKIELRKHASHTLGCTTKQTRNTQRRRGGQYARNPQVRWASTRSRHDGSPTDTQVDTKSRSPHSLCETFVSGGFFHAVPLFHTPCKESW